MSNNIGFLNTEKFSRTIGNLVDIDDPSLINTRIGSLDVGFMAFDSDGTLGVCTAMRRDSNDNPIYTFRTAALNTEIDIDYILSQNY